MRRSWQFFWHFFYCVKILIAGLGNHSTHAGSAPWSVSLCQTRRGNQKSEKETKIPSNTAVLENHNFAKEFQKKGEKKLSLAKRQDRDQNCTKKGSGFMGFSIPFDKNYDPSLVYHFNQLQVLTQYFITVHWAISRLLTGFWPVNHTCWVSHTLSASLHAACWHNERRLSLQAELPATPWNSRPRSQS